MTKFKKIIPAVALVVALSPFAASAYAQGAAHNTGYLNGTTIASKVAANSKGRPAEFNTNTNQVAANSKGRPAEFNTATNNQVADNSKGRPAEFAPSVPETPIG